MARDPGAGREGSRRVARGGPAAAHPGHDPHQHDRGDVPDGRPLVKVPAPLRLRQFRLLLAGRTINALGNAFAPIALAFAVLDLTGSATDLGFVVGARTVVNVVFLLFGGVLADRLPKNLLMVGSSVAAGLTQAVVAALVLTGTATIPLLIVLAAINGMVAALALPASASILPQVVPEEGRQQANAISRLALNSAAILGAPTAGVVVAAVGPGWGIVVDAITFVVSAFCFAALGVRGKVL